MATQHSRRMAGTGNARPVETLLGRLDRPRQTGPGRWLARCPAHEDRSPSLSVRETEDGRVLIHCFGGCGAVDVVTAVGLGLADLFPPRLADHLTGRPAAPPIPWREVIDAMLEDLTACSIAFRDLAAGVAWTPEDAAYIAERADSLATQLRRARHGR